jgi:hypothetical protein
MTRRCKLDNRSSSAPEGVRDTRFAEGHTKKRDIVNFVNSPGKSHPVRPSDQTSRLCFTAASMKLANSGWGSKGLDFSSGWNCTPTTRDVRALYDLGKGTVRLMPLNSSPPASSADL